MTLAIKQAEYDERLAGLAEQDYRELFEGSAMKRAKWRGIVRNACNALGNSGLQPGTDEGARIEGLLERLALCEEPSIAESALWALRRMRKGA